MVSFPLSLLFSLALFLPLADGLKRFLTAKQAAHALKLKP